MNDFVLLTALLALSGCTANPIATTQATDVSAYRVFAKPLLIAGSGVGRVVIKRDSGHV